MQFDLLTDIQSQTKQLQKQIEESTSTRRGIQTKKAAKKTKKKIRAAK
jgi:hypothetical protein